MNLFHPVSPQALRSTPQRNLNTSMEGNEKRKAIFNLEIPWGGSLRDRPQGRVRHPGKQRRGAAGHRTRVQNSRRKDVKAKVTASPLHPRSRSVVQGEAGGRVGRALRRLINQGLNLTSASY